MLHSFHAAPFPWCTFLYSNLFTVYYFMLDYFQVVPFSRCTFFILHNFYSVIFCVALFYVLHYFMLHFYTLQCFRFAFSSCSTLDILHFFTAALCSCLTVSRATARPTQRSTIEGFAIIIHKAFEYCCKVLHLRSFRGSYLRLYCFHVALFLSHFSFRTFLIWKKIENEQKKENTTPKTPLHSAQWICFTFILISYNTFLLL